MSAITLFAIANTIVPKTQEHALVRTLAEEPVLCSRLPAVSARWRVEIDERGNRRLVERWSATKRDRSA